MTDKWNLKDERCPHCNSITKEAKGFSKQNLKKLCFSKPSMQDIIIFIMLILCLTIYYTYTTEVGQYREIYENPDKFCNTYFLQIQNTGLPLLEGNPIDIQIEKDG